MGAIFDISYIYHYENLDFPLFYGRNYFFECPKIAISSAFLIIANYSLS